MTTKASSCAVFSALQSNLDSTIPDKQNVTVRIPQAPQKPRTSVVVSASALVSRAPETKPSRKPDVVSTLAFGAPRLSALDTVSPSFCDKLDFRIPIFLLVHVRQGRFSSYPWPGFRGEGQPEVRLLRVAVRWLSLETDPQAWNPRCPIELGEQLVVRCIVAKRWLKGGRGEWPERARRANRNTAP